MVQRSPGARLLALAVVLALAGPWAGALAGGADATLTGVIRGADRSPLAGARLCATDPETGTLTISEPTTADGNFTLELSGGTYELAVAQGEYLYFVPKAFYVVPGVIRHVQIAVDPRVVDPDAPTLPQKAPSLWNNPLIAGLFVFGTAVVVGVVVENWTSDEFTSTPTTIP